MEEIKRMGRRHTCQIHNYHFEDKDASYVTFPKLEELDFMKHLFSTRLGGVSENEFAQMNLSYNRGDKKEAVDENFRRIGEILGYDTNAFVCSDQTHTTNIRKVTKADCGKGVTKLRDYHDVDGLITNEPGIVLSTFFADCVPVYIVDPVNKAIGMIHSGWKGTINRIGYEAIQAMSQEYGTDPKDCIAVIGPSICQSCYEVSEDLAVSFLDEFSEEILAFCSIPKYIEAAAKAFFMDLAEEKIHRGDLMVKLMDQLCYKKPNGKYQLNLHFANLLVLLGAGLVLENVEITDLCTCCNPELFHSHRATNGVRGNLGAFLVLK